MAGYDSGDQPGPQWWPNLECGSHSILQQPEGARETHLVIHPATAATLLHSWISPAHVLHLHEEFERSSGNILRILEANGHWTLL